MTGRRQFITLLGGAALWPTAVWPQQAERVRRVGMLIGTGQADPNVQRPLAALRQGILESGWTEGRNLQIDIRWSEGDLDRVRTYAAELVAMRPDVLVATGAPQATELRRLTGTIPIVFVQVPDPVELGLVASLARPGGNVTGFTHFELALGGKWLEALKEIAPGISRVMLLQNPDHPAWPGFLRIIKAAAPSLGVEIVPAGIRDASAIEGAMDAFAREPGGGVIVLPSPPTTMHRKQIIALAGRHRLPAIYPFPYFAVEGGLMSFGADDVDLWRRSASYIDRILRGATPNDLPVQAPNKFSLVINRKTAQALDLTIPSTLLAIADEVIE